MACASAHIACARGCRTVETLPAEQLIKLRSLYLERRYKQCIAACDELLQAKLHPVHQTFLLFHQAISYESLGITAHIYSTNKIPFLDSAKDKFASALQILPQPYATTGDGYCATPKPSPLTPGFRVPDIKAGGFGIPRTDSTFLSRSRGDAGQDVDSDSDSDESSCSSDDTRSETHTTPNFDVDTPSHELDRAHQKDIKFDNCSPSTSVDEENVHEKLKSCDPFQLTHQNRLGASLSSDHVVADELVPSPLFSRTKKLAALPAFTYPEVSPAANDICENSIETAISSTKQQRPLPPLPFFKQQPIFKKYLGRYVLISTRKTAIQTLIKKFEGAIPLPSPLSQSFSPMSTPTTTAPSPMTPVTLRFNLIREFLAPRPTTNQEPRGCLSSVSLARYNASLAALRTQVLFHLASLEGRLEEVRAAQLERMARKEKMANVTAERQGQQSGGRGMSRVASYWSFKPEPPITSTLRHVTAVRDPSRRSQHASANPKRFGEWDEEEEIDKKRTRIDRLRREGFNIRKERYGFKGEAYYEELRRRVEVEIGLASV